MLSLTVVSAVIKTLMLSLAVNIMMLSLAVCLQLCGH